MNTLVSVLSLSILILVPRVLGQDPPWTTYDVNGLDFAPDFAPDEVYPPLNDTAGIETLRGVRLYGYTSCGSNEKTIINQAWDDFYTLAQQKALYDTIDWDHQAAKEFWGSSAGRNSQLNDDTKTEIKQIFEATQQMWASGWKWILPLPPPIGPGSLWIRVRCSGGNGNGDPEDVCRDVDHNNKRCRAGGQPLDPNDDARLYAYSDNAIDGLWYSRFTFCTKFFNDLKSLKDAETFATGAKQQNNLEYWGNRAQVIFHEATHLDYFMNAPAKSPPTDDVTIKLRGQTWQTAYGSRLAKVLQNYARHGRYTQLNADNFAWFAMAKYVESRIGAYPEYPKTQQKPEQAPRDSHGASYNNALDITEDEDVLDEQQPPAVEGVSAPPKCPDRDPSHDPLDAQTAIPTPQISSPQCDMTKSSGLPYNVFAGTYSNFCQFAGRKKALKWPFNSKGEFKDQKTLQRLVKRTPPANPASYDDYTIALEWHPNDTFNPDDCLISCQAAYAMIANSPCGHTASQQNIMAEQGTIDNKCGTYSWKITGGPSSNPAPAPPATPQNGDTSCLPADKFGSHGSIDETAMLLMARDSCGTWQTKQTTFSKSSAPLTNTQVVGGIAYDYKLSWKDGCTAPQADMDFMEPNGKGVTPNCPQLFYNAYKNCNNGGIGGNVVFNCLVYDFAGHNK